MSESLKTRVGRVITGGMHAFLDRLENQAPEAMMGQSIRDVDAIIDEVRQELGRVSANRHLAQQQHAALNSQHVTLSAQIDEALAAGREDLAQAAVARQLDIEAQLPVLESTLGDHAGKEGELQAYVAALLAKKREMQAELTEYSKHRAAAASTLAASGSAVGSVLEQRMDSVTNAFERIYEAQTGLSAASRGSSLQQTAQLKALDDMIRDNKIAERMAQLKAAKP